VANKTVDTPLAGPGRLSPRLRTLRISLRPMTDADQPLLAALYGSFRAYEMARMTWTDLQKQAFVAEQFRLQHQHFTTHFPDCDFWIVERAPPGRLGGAADPIGRLYADRSRAVWRVVDLGLFPTARGCGVGGALLAWLQAGVRAAGAQGCDLHVMIANPRAQALYARLGFEVAGETGGYRHMIWRPDRGGLTLRRAR
jgi:RimJ/RimL family protein N-acetyltransferase